MATTIACKIKFTLLVVFTLASHIAGDGSWLLDHEYKYSLITKKLTLMPKDVWTGSVVRARLSIVPESKNVFTGELSDAEIAQVKIAGKWDSQLNDKNLIYKKLPESKEFKINLNNGVVQSISMNNNMTDEQIHQVNVLASQLQVDTNDQNSQNALYQTTEPTLSGNCETVYDINPYSEYSVKANSDLKPLHQSNKFGELINIVKTRNYNNCSELINGTNTLKINQRLIQSESTQIVLYGSLRRNTIQSSVTTNKAISLDAPQSTTIFFVKLKIESMEKRDYWTPLSKHVQNFIKKTSKADQYSNCWSRFYAYESMCKFDFGPEWTSVGSADDCGFLKRRSLCRRQYPGCEASVCYSRLIDDICEEQFGKGLPVKRGEFSDCSPGFYRHRCCSQ